MKYLINKILNYSILLACFVATVFIFLNSYETVFSKDVKYINAIKVVNIDTVLDSFIQKNKIIFPEYEGSMIEDFGVPLYLKISGSTSTIQLTKSIKNHENKWLCRLNSGHYLFLNTNNDNDLIIYIKKSWRTIDNVELLKEGDNIFIETSNSFIYMYQINDVRKTYIDGQYNIADKSDDANLIIIVEDGDMNYVVKANFISSQIKQDE